jgi:hypothetical protein
MNGKTLIAVVLPFALAFVLGGSFAVSQAAGFEGWFGIGAPVAKAPETEKAPLEDLETRLTLREDQQKEFRGFREYCDKDLCACRNRIARARTELGTAILSEPPDPERIEAARRKLLAVYDECSREMVEKLVGLKENLDTEQRKKLADAFFPGASLRCGGSSNEGCGRRCGKRCGKGSRED